jgi:transcriptional regulator with XRE-family HTH domain
MNYQSFFKELRTQNGLSHAQVAEKTGCHRNTVINVERGRPVRFATISKMMASMGATEEQTKTMAMLWVGGTAHLEVTGESEAWASASQPMKTAWANLKKHLDAMDSDQLETMGWVAASPSLLKALKIIKECE